MKKKLDSDVIDLGVALEHANAANAESQRNISLIQGNIRNVQKRFEEESRAKAVATDNLISADRRANANQNALEEARTLLEQADRNRRMVSRCWRICKCLKKGGISVFVNPFPMSLKY